MRKLLITLDDDLDPWLASKVNQNEVVRNALSIYKGDITTDTLEGMRHSYSSLKKSIEVHFDYYDECFSRMDKLISVLESRM
jgi:hypothetical protein